MEHTGPVWELENSTTPADKKKMAATCILSIVHTVHHRVQPGMQGVLALRGRACARARRARVIRKNEPRSV